MLSLQNVSISGYRSIRNVTMDVDDLNVFVGVNGAGKTNLYRALQLLQGASLGTLSREIASEGGMASALWAGRRPRAEPARISLSATFRSRDNIHSHFVYALEIGMPRQMTSAGVAHTFDAAFQLEPQVKEESVILHRSGRKRELLRRRGPAVTAMDAAGQTREVTQTLLPSETALGSFD